MAEYNVDEYTVEGENTQYNFKISLVDNKINLQLTDISESAFVIPCLFHPSSGFPGSEHIIQRRKLYSLDSSFPFC